MTIGNNSTLNGFSWALLELESGNKVTRVGWHSEERYLLRLKDGIKYYIALVYEDGEVKVWQESQEDASAEDWVIFIEQEQPQENVYYVNGVVKVEHYFHKGTQHNYGYYSGWNIGDFTLISTDLFDPETVMVKTCCGYDASLYNAKNGFLFQIAEGKTSKLIKFLSDHPDAPLTIYLGMKKYELGRYTGLSTRNNYYWESGEVQKFLDSYLNADSLGKSYEITMQFKLDNLKS